MKTSTWHPQKPTNQLGMTLQHFHTIPRSCHFVPLVVDPGMNFPKHWDGTKLGLWTGLWTRFWTGQQTNFAFPGLPAIQYLTTSSLVSKVGFLCILSAWKSEQCVGRKLILFELETEYDLASDTLVACKTRD